MAVFDSSVGRGLPASCPPKGVLSVEIPEQLSFSLEEVVFDVRLWESGTIVFDQADVQTTTIPAERFSPDGWLRTPFRESEIRCAHVWKLESRATTNPALRDREDRLGSGAVRILDVRPEFDSLRKGWSFCLSYRTSDSGNWRVPRIALAVRDLEHGHGVVSVFDTRSCSDIPSDLPCEGTVRLELPDGCSFAPGAYAVDFRAWTGKEPADDIVGGAEFEVDEDASSPGWLDHPPYKVGVLNLRHRWSFRSGQQEEH